MQKSTFCTQLLCLISRLFFNFIPLSVVVVFYSCNQTTDLKIEQTNADVSAAARGTNGMFGINVLLKSEISRSALNDLAKYGSVLDLIPEIHALTMRTTAEGLAAIKKLPFVDTANPDAVRSGAPIDAVSATDFTNGLSTWNLDAVNVTNLGAGRTIPQDATGVYIGILDTGLLDSWRQYFPQERIATQYAKSFGGGGGENGNVSEQPNKWEHDQNSHGTHVTSTVLGFQVGTTKINGVAPMATIIPVKVLNQNGSGWSSVIARGIVYIAELKRVYLSGSPVVINMSLGGPELDAIEKSAIDYAIAQGVIIVASAGNGGEAGMGYPGAYQPVISVANLGYVNQFASASWWLTANISDPTNISEFYVAPSSSRQKAGQDLDVAAPGTYIVGPYQVNSGQLSYYYLTGTSMASPHVAGIVALMAQAKPELTATEAETALVTSATPIGPGSRAVINPNAPTTTTTINWGADAPGAGLVTADAAISAIH
jgi:subtilisin